MQAYAPGEASDAALGAARESVRTRIGDRWFTLRNRMLANAGFQRWAFRFPLTRPVSLNRSGALFDLCAGFVYSQVLLACVQLKLFDIMSNGPHSLERLAARMSLPVDAASRLLEAAVALRLAERRRDGWFGLGVLGAALTGNPGAVSMIEHHALLYADLRDPVALLRGDQPDTALGRLWPYAGKARPANLAADDVSDYSALMAASLPLVAADVLAAYPLGRHRCLLDLGGGDGTFLTMAAAAAPALGLVLFDLPAVARRARAQLAGAGLENRAQVVGGDFRTDMLPTGADIVSLIRVIHDHDDEAARTILRAAWQALPPGGTLLLAEPMAATPGARRVGAYFGFYLLAMGSGRPRTARQLSTMLQQAGFPIVRVLPARRPMLVRAIVATR